VFTLLTLGGRCGHGGDIDDVVEVDGADAALLVEHHVEGAVGAHVLHLGPLLPQLRPAPRLALRHVEPVVDLAVVHCRKHRACIHTGPHTHTHTHTSALLRANIQAGVLVTVPLNK
jgi:hypothetical protein